MPQAEPSTAAIETVVDRPDTVVAAVIDPEDCVITEALAEEEATLVLEPEEDTT
jgi:hypothetical protein